LELGVKEELAQKIAEGKKAPRVRAQEVDGFRVLPYGYRKGETTYKTYDELKKAHPAAPDLRYNKLTGDTEEVEKRLTRLEEKQRDEKLAKIGREHSQRTYRAEPKVFNEEAYKKKKGALITAEATSKGITLKAGETASKTFTDKEELERYLDKHGVKKGFLRGHKDRKPILKMFDEWKDAENTKFKTSGFDTEAEYGKHILEHQKDIVTNRYELSHNQQRKVNQRSSTLTTQSDRSLRR
jgi:hypothetical protein